MMRTISPEFSLDVDYHRSREDVGLVEQRHGGLLIRRKNAYMPRFEGITASGGRVRYHTMNEVLDFLRRSANPRSF